MNKQAKDKEVSQVLSLVDNGQVRPSVQAQNWRGSAAILSRVTSEIRFEDWLIASSRALSACSSKLSRKSFFLALNSIIYATRL